MKTVNVNDASVKKSFDTNGNTDDCDEDIVSDKRGSMFGRTGQNKKQDSELGPGQPKSETESETENPEARSSDEMSSRLSMMWRDHSGSGAANAADPSKSFMFQLGVGPTAAGQHNAALAAGIGLGQANPVFKFDTFDKFSPATAEAASRLRRGSCDDRTFGVSPRWLAPIIAEHLKLV